MKNYFVFQCNGYTITYYCTPLPEEQGYPTSKTISGAGRFTREDAQKMVDELKDWIGGTIGIGTFNR